jgi:hypothetical protein
VGHCADPRGAVDIEADVVPTREAWLAGVEADSHADYTPVGPRYRCMVSLHGDGCAQRVGCTAKHHEEPVARGVDLAPSCSVMARRTILRCSSRTSE